MKKIIVQGGGLVGRVIAFDLGEKFQVTVIDNDRARLALLSRLMPNIKLIQADLSILEESTALLDDADLIINALPPAIGFQALRAVIEAGKNSVSVATLLGDTRELDRLAKRKGVTAVIDAGIAPGLSNLILGHHVQQMEIHEYECFFGGLPRIPEWPLYHRDFYPPSELLAEYLHSAEIVDQGQVTSVTPLNHIEQIEFPELGVLAAIHYNGLGTLAQTMGHKIQHMRQKMLRYPQHLDYILTLRKCGLLSNELVQLAADRWVRPLDLTAKVLEAGMNLGENDSDVITLRVTMRSTTQSYVYRLFDQYDHATQFTAMSRTTGYTCAAMSRVVLNGIFAQQGIVSPEFMGMQPACFSQIIDELKSRGLTFDIEHTEHEKLKHNALIDNPLSSVAATSRVSCEESH